MAHNIFMTEVVVDGHHVKGRIKFDAAINGFKFFMELKKPQAFDETTIAEFHDELLDIHNQIVTLNATIPTVVSIAVSPASATLAVNGTQALTVTATYNDNSTKDVTADATFTSSDVAIATVAGGVVTAQAAGSATITATFDGKQATSTITVS